MASWCTATKALAVSSRCAGIRVAAKLELVPATAAFSFLTYESYDQSAANDSSNSSIAGKSI